MTRSKSYHSFLIESLRDPLEASAYIDAVLEEADPQHIMLALKNVVEAQRQVTGVRELGGEWVDRILAQSEPPSLVDFAKLLNDLGLRLSVVSEEERLVA